MKYKNWNLFYWCGMLSATFTAFSHFCTILWHLGWQKRFVFLILVGWFPQNCRKIQKMDLSYWFLTRGCILYGTPCTIKLSFLASKPLLNMLIMMQILLNITCLKMKFHNCHYSNAQKNWLMARNRHMPLIIGF